MQNEVYGFCTDVDGGFFYMDKEQFLVDMKANELSNQEAAEASNQGYANNKLIEARLNQKMTERLAQPSYQMPRAQANAIATMNTYGISGLDEYGRPMYDMDSDLRGARSVDTSPAGLMRNVTGRRGGRRRTIRL